MLRSARHRNPLAASVGLVIALSLVAGAAATPATAGRPSPSKSSKPTAPAAKQKPAPKTPPPAKAGPKSNPKPPSPKPPTGPLLDGVRRVSVARSEFVDDYLNTDGSHTAVMGLEPRNVKDARGGFVPIVKAVRANRDGDLVTGAHALSPKFSKRASADKTVSFAPGGNPVSFGLIGSRAVPATKLGTTGVRYAGVLDGVDLDYRVTNDAVKEELVIRKRPAAAVQSKGNAAKSAAQLSWQFVYNAPGLKASKSRDGSIAFKNKRGVVVASVPPGEAWDSNVSKRSVVPVSYSLGKRGRTTILTASIDRAWATAAKRAYPLHVDPTFTHENTSGISYYRWDNITATEVTAVGCLSCGIRVGTDKEPVSQTWRTAAKFPYEQLYGTQIDGVAIKLELNETLSSYLPTQLPLTVHAADPVPSFNAFDETVLASQSVQQKTTIVTGNPLNDRLTAKIRGWVTGREASQRLFFKGTERPGQHTYNEMTATMTVAYTPNTHFATPVYPKNGAKRVPQIPVPTFRIAYSNPTLQQRYRYVIYDAKRVLWTSAWTDKTQVTPPAFSLPNQLEVFWRVDLDDNFTRGVGGHDTTSPIRYGPEWAFSTIREDLPIIFVPGTGGSTIEDADGHEVYPNAVAVAASPNDSHFDVLQFESDGRTEKSEPFGPLHVGHVTKVVGLHPWSEDIYDSTYNFLHGGGYKDGVSLFPFPYDWRRSQQHNAALLRLKIAEVQRITGFDKVNILAHSLGGLVASTAVEGDAATAAKVNRIVTLGSPHLGVARVLGQLKYNEPCQTRIAGKCWIDNDELAKLMRNWPGLLEMLPGRNYVTAATSPIVVSRMPVAGPREDKWLSFADYRAKLADKNMPLIDSAFEWHNDHDGWAPASRQLGLLRIVGEGHYTIAAVREQDEQKCTWSRGPAKPVCKIVTVNSFELRIGDGVAERNSAGLHNQEKGFDLRGNGLNHYVRVHHDDLPKDLEVLKMAIRYLKLDGPNPTRSAAQSARCVGCSNSIGAAGAAHHMSATSDDDDPQTPEDELAPLPEGISLTPGHLSGSALDVHGSVYGSLRDSSGHVTGVTDTILKLAVENIPLSQYDAGTEYSSTVLQRDGDYEGTWRATEDGEVKFRLRTYADNDVSRLVAFPPLEVRSGAVLTMSLHLPGIDPAPALRIDDDGNGVVDRTVPAFAPVTGPAILDVTPPEAVGVVTRRYIAEDGKRMARVELTATDNAGGSGVAEIQYVVGRTGERGAYTGPFELLAEGDLFIRAVDAAGNVQMPYYAFALDEHADHVEAVHEFLEPHVNLAGQLAYEGDEDWIGLNLAAGETQVQLIGMAQDYDLEVYDAQLALVSASRVGGNRSEKLQVDGPGGRYFVRVVSAHGEWSAKTGYRLNIGEAK